MTTDDGYADWLRSNPAPDLQELVGCHGGYDKITPEAWAEYGRAMADWHERRRTRRVVVRGEGADRDALCICGLPGIYLLAAAQGRRAGDLALRAASRSVAELRQRRAERGRRAGASREGGGLRCQRRLRRISR
jgi:hypothetical protein